MRDPSWYVIQVQTGREHIACQDILRACEQQASLDAAAEQPEAQVPYDHEAMSDEPPEAQAPTRPAKRVPIITECFSPRYATQVKLHGEWVDEERKLLPGYVVAVTEDPWRLARVLRTVPGFTRILGMGKTFEPLSTDDKSWIERWTREGDRTIPMSIAYKEGDTVVVTEGPLKGNEGMITRIRRRKNLADLEIHAGQLTIRTTVGLAVLPAPQEEVGQKATS